VCLCEWYFLMWQTNCAGATYVKMRTTTGSPVYWMRMVEEAVAIALLTLVTCGKQTTVNSLPVPHQPQPWTR